MSASVRESGVMAPIRERLRSRRASFGGLYAGNARAVIERGFRVIRNQNWGVIATGFFEPVFYLLAMGMGMGALVGSVPGPDGRPISYAMYIAPALLATSAMRLAGPSPSRPTISSTKRSACATQLSEYEEK